ncbi:hypothetical protein ACWEU6_22035 [Streptosporangium sandarakinum]
MIGCLCGQEAICPCEIHEPEAFTTWLTEKAPRLAKARADGDPIYNRSLDDMADHTANVPELAELRAALSDLAREQLEKDWDLTLGMEPWPDAWEFALTARDSWRDMVLPCERNALRERLAAATLNDEYPLGYKDEVDLSGQLRPVSNEDLWKEAQALAEIARRALELERMLRDHAGGWATAATQYPPAD